MINYSKTIKLPKEAQQGCKIVLEELGNVVVGMYLYGSAITGGLRIHSDIDVLVIVKQNLTDAIRKKLIRRIMKVSGKVGNTSGIHPLEITIINLKDVVPWRYPPKIEFQYGEWRRDEFEQGEVPKQTYDPDLTIILSEVRQNSISLIGPKPSEILDLVPFMDIKRAISDSLSNLINNRKGDERNVLLTLSRMWLTVSINEVAAKDVAAEWAIERLPKELTSLLDYARNAYVGECDDNWEGRDTEVTALVNYIRQQIEKCLDS